MKTSVTVENNEANALEQRVTLEWDGYASSSSKVVELAANSEQTIEFTPTLNVTGYQTLQAEYATSEPVHVTNASVDVDVSGRTLQTQSIYTKENVVANATVTNNGGNPIQYAVTLTANETGSSPRYRTKVVSVDGGNSSNVTLNRYLGQAGEFCTVLNGQAVGNVTVRRPYNATNLTVDDSTVVAGQPASVTVDVQNRKSSSIDREVILKMADRGYWKNLDRAAFELNASEQKEVAFSATFSEPGQHQIRAGNSERTEVEVLSAVNVSNVSMPAAPVYRDEPVTVNATVTNRLDTSTTQTVRLEEVHDSWYESLASKEVQLAAGESKRIAIPYTFERRGERTVRIGGDETRTVEVTQSPVSVRSVAVSDRELAAGETTTVTATLSNHGSTGAAFNATLNIDGDEYADNSRQIHKTVYVDAGGEKTVEFTPTFTMGGSHSIAVQHDDAGLVSVNDTTVSVVSGDVAADSVYKRDATSVSVTINNTEGANKQYAITAQADKNGSEWSTETNTTVVSVGENAETTTDIILKPYAAGNYTITANGQPVDTLRVERGVKVEGVEFSDRVVSVDETLYFNQTLNNPTSKERTYYTQINDQSIDTVVPAKTTRDVSRKLAFSNTGVKRVWADGQSYRLFVVEDTSGSADLAFERTYTPGEVVNGSNAGVFAKVSNTGDADAVRNVSLSVDGTEVASEQFYVPANTTRDVYLEHTFQRLGDYTAELNISGGPTKQFGGTVRSEVVVDGSASVSYVSGTQPTSMPVVDAEYQGGSIYLKVTQNGEYVRDLAGLGADSTTKFNVSFLVKNYEPRLALGTGRGIDLNVADTNQEGTKRVSITASPSQLDFKYNFEGERPRSPAEWENKVKNNSADFGWETALHLRVGNAKTAFSSVDASTLSGMTVATDAQMFSMPRYVPNTSTTQPHLEVSLAAPHKTVAGNVNTGYYVAHLPDALLSEWNVTNPKQQLSASFQNQNLNMTVEETADGATVNISLHYSSGTLQIAKSTDTAGESGSGDTPTGDESPGSDTTGGTDSSTNRDTSGSVKTTESTTTSGPATTEPATTEQTTAAQPTAATEATTSTADTTATTAESETPTRPESQGSTGGNTPGFGMLVAVVAAAAALGLRSY